MSLHSIVTARKHSYITVTVTVNEALVLRPLLWWRAHHRVNPYPSARRQNETEIVFISQRNESVDHTYWVKVERLYVWRRHFIMLCTMFCV